MAKGWNGANEAEKTELCEVCGSTNLELKLFHGISVAQPSWVPPSWNPPYNDHVVICKECAEDLPEDEWAGCGCGG